MKNFESWTWSNYDSEDEEELILEELVPESVVESAFKEVGYVADDVQINNDDLNITVIPVSNEYDGSFSKNLCNNIQKIANKIFADNFYFTSEFRIIFTYEKETLKMLANSNKFNV